MTTAALEQFSGLPGFDLVEAGMRDLERGVESVEALLVSIAAYRLTAVGLEPPATIASPEHRLYELLAAEDQDSAHSRYNALIRRIVSFESAAELLTSSEHGEATEERSTL